MSSGLIPDTESKSSGVNPKVNIKKQNETKQPTCPDNPQSVSTNSVGKLGKGHFKQTNDKNARSRCCRTQGCLKGSF